MENFLEIIRGRQSPGIIVFDFDNRLLYSNSEILALIPDIKASGDRKDERRAAIFAQFSGLCDRLKHSLLPGSQDQTEKTGMISTLMADGRESVISMRAFVINGHGAMSDKGHIMILAERVVENHDRNFDKIKKDFSFTTRELEVLKLICAGLSNRAIAEKLFISEHTAKDHLKHIMQKMTVSSRNEIMAALKS